MMWIDDSSDDPGLGEMKWGVIKTWAEKDTVWIIGDTGNDDDEKKWIGLDN